MFNIIKEIDGCYGTRFSGSGFKGCCIAFLDPKKAKNIMDEVEEKYLTLYPRMKEKYSAHICHSADGVRL